MHRCKQPTRRNNFFIY